ncbi:histidine kinase [Nocardioides sp. TF02-7]|uniref:sensor histidine kinase n=1 Tax=Nocardioides sp. TF02-7 TaxID=2917724 RepID=UPI001F05CD6D|nr:histidine kinase [Nocardioides sp. TF02-7]UMG91550.1 histidine kinase [Nocardioides sp. TF02-7]
MPPAVPPTVPLRSRVADFFAFDDPWEREGALARGDWLVGLAAAVFGVTSLELYRSVGVLDSVDEPRWVQWAVLTVGALLLVGRRRWPLTVALLAAVHMFGTGVWMPAVMGQVSLQIVYFVAFFSGVAWARSRRDMAVVIGAVLVFMAAWIAWQLALGAWVDDLRADFDDEPRPGWVGPVTASVLITALINALYFGGAVLGGQVSWRGARQRARLAEQAATIAEQAEALQRRAVVEERLRIARELHDVVAHHVSVIGVQAAAGRRLLGRDGEAVATALSHVEESAREAVGQMRSLVGTLREPAYDDTDGPDVPAEARAPEPRWTDLPALVSAAGDSGLSVRYDLVESPDGAATTLPDPVGTSVYRIVQEALTNVRRHSTADRATVVLRVDRVSTPPFVEVEVTDNGRPRGRTSGTGLGLLGVRERAAARRADVEIGPRPVGGFRVRVRFPLGTEVPG